MQRCLFVFICLFTFINSASAIPEEDEARAKALVKQLRSNEFRVREKAAKELIALGAASKKALEEGCKSTDADLAERCQKLLPHAFECYLKQLLDEQVANPKATVPDELPGLKR